MFISFIIMLFSDILYYIDISLHVPKYLYTG